MARPAHVTRFARWERQGGSQPSAQHFAGAKDARRRAATCPKPGAAGRFVAPAPPPPPLPQSCPNLPPAQPYITPYRMGRGDTEFAAGAAGTTPNTAAGQNLSWGARGNWRAPNVPCSRAAPLRGGQASTGCAAQYRGNPACGRKTAEIASHDYTIVKFGATL